MCPCGTESLLETPGTGGGTSPRLAASLPWIHSGLRSGASKAEERSSGGLRPSQMGRTLQLRDPNAIIPPGPPLIFWGLRPQDRHPGPVRGAGAAASHRLLPARCGVCNKKPREGEGGLDGGGGAGVGEGKLSGKLSSLDLPGSTDQRGLRPKALSHAGWGTCFPFSDPLIAPALVARKRDSISLLGSPGNIFSQLV